MNKLNDKLPIDDKRKQKMSISVKKESIERIVNTGDANAALLYFYMLNNDGRIDEVKAIKQLKFSAKQLCDAEKILEDIGILKDASDDAPEIRVVTDRFFPEPSQEALTELKSDKLFLEILKDWQSISGRTLTVNEVRVLGGLYRQAKMPAEVIMLLMHHCAETTIRRFGPEQKPSIKLVEKLGCSWVEQDVLNIEKAETWLKEEEKQRSVVSEVKKILQIYNRPLVETELSYINQWISTGFSVEAIEEAYERTIVKTGAMNWKYMDAIMNSWNENGIYTKEDIDKKDGKKRKKQTTETVTQPDLEAYKRMVKIREKIKGDR